MRHDRYTVGGGKASKCYYGYVYAYNGNNGRSVMSYADYCDDNGGNCTRKGRFSIDATTGGGVKLGVGCGAGITGMAGSADNHAQFLYAAPIVADYR